MQEFPRIEMPLVEQQNHKSNAGKAPLGRGFSFFWQSTHFGCCRLKRQTAREKSRAAVFSFSFSQVNSFTFWMAVGRAPVALRAVGPPFRLDEAVATL